MLVELLGDAHGLTDRHPELPRSLLLEGRCGERSRRSPDSFLLLYVGYRKDSPDALLKECLRAFHVWESPVESCLHEHLVRCSFRMEYRIYLIICFMIESEDLPFAVNHQAEGHRLHTSCGKLRLDLPPEHRRKLESYKPVEHASCLLCVNEAHVYAARILYRVEDGVPGNFVEHDSLRLVFSESESLEQMP